MSLYIKLIPLIIVIILLSKKHHMLFAGFIGGVIAMIIGRITIEDASGIFLESISKMLSITVPIIYAAAASMVSQAGSIKALVNLANRKLKGRTDILAGIIILIQGLATYMSGMGAGNTMVIAPLAMQAVGFVPEVVGSMAVITTFGYTTSPASLESILVGDAVNITAQEHAMSMGIFTLTFFALAIINGVIGVRRRNIIKENEDDLSSSNVELVKNSIPFIALLLMVILGSSINKLIDIKIFTPVTIVIFTSILTTIFTDYSINDTSNALVKGSTFILTTLFSVGMFLGFIELIASLGTFTEIANLLKYIPENLVLPASILLAFLIAIPSGAYTAGVFTLILPSLITLGLPGRALGFVVIATGLGAQISPVQINVAALADGFDKSIEEIIKSNVKYVLTAVTILIIISFFII